MSRKPRPRRIVIDGIEYRWELRVDDDYNFNWLGLTVVAAAPPPSPTGVNSVLSINLSRSTLILPSYVRRLILEARAAGWNPFEALPEGFRFQPKAGPYADEPDPKKRRAPDDDEKEPSVLADARRGRTPKLKEELLASIRDADENDDAPRLVYADWLLQRGELQGEYINLACAQRRGPMEDERMEELFQKHQWQWLGAIGDVTTTRRWNRGLVEDVLIERRSRGVVEPAIGDPGWLSVRRVDTRGRFMIASDIAHIVGHPVLRNLDALATTADVLTLLVEMDAVPDVEELTVTWDANDTTSPAALLAILSSLQDSQVTPRRLKRLFLSDGIARDALLSAIDDPQLTVLVVSSLSNVGDWQKDPNRHLSNVLKELHLARWLPRMFEPLNFEARLRYDERTGLYSHLHVRWTAQYETWARNELLMGIGQLESDALTVLSAEGPVAVATEGDATSVLPARLDNDWLRDLRESVRNQRSISFQGVLLNR